MSHIDLPDRVSLDLRKHERQEREAALEHRLNKSNRIFEAREAIRDSEQLRQILDNEELAGPLAELMDSQEALAYEVACLERDHALLPEKFAAIRTCAVAVAKLERQLLLYQLGDS